MRSKSWTELILMLGIGAIGLASVIPSETKQPQLPLALTFAPTAAGQPGLSMSMADLPDHLKPLPRDINILAKTER